MKIIIVLIGNKNHFKREDAMEQIVPPHLPLAILASIAVLWTK